MRRLPRLRWLVAGLVVLAALVIGLSAVTDVPGPPVREWLGLAEYVDITCEPDPAGVRSPEQPPAPAGSWRPEPELPGRERPELDAAVFDGRVYLAGGLTEDGKSLVPHSVDTLVAFDPATRSYLDMPPLPERIDHPLVAAYDGDLYLVGGFRDGVPTTAAWRLDLASGEWSKLAPLRQARGALAGDVVDGKLYAVGGATEVAPSGFVDSFATVEILDLETGVWSFGSDMPTARHHFSVVALDGALYAIGGRNAHTLRLDVVERFDPASGRWDTLEPLPLGVGSGDATRAGRGIVVTGGGNDLFDDPAGWVTPAVFAYSPSEGRWSRLPDMTTARHGHAAAAAGGRIFVFGGAPCPGFGLLRTVESLPVPAALAS